MTNTLTVGRAGGEPQPYIATRPDLTIGGHDLRCLASRISITPDVSTTDVVSFCGSQTFPGNVAWTFAADLFLSYDAAGTEDALCEIWDAWEANRTRPEVTVKPFADQPTGPDNPEWTTTVTPQPYGFEWTAGEAATVTIEWSCTEPEREPPCATARAARTQPAASQPAPVSA